MTPGFISFIALPGRHHRLITAEHFGGKDPHTPTLHNWDGASYLAKLLTFPIFVAIKIKVVALESDFFVCPCSARLQTTIYLDGSGAAASCRVASEVMALKDLLFFSSL